MAKLAKVLLVDDEPDLRRIGQLALRNVGKLEVVLAATGVEGIQLAKTHRPDAILLDVMMPEMDGLAVFAELAAGDATRAIPVVFLTAKSNAADVSDLLALGARGVIQKPFDPMQLAAELRRLLEVA